MVTLNFTIIVELGLFLIFLAVTHALILRPMLDTMDKRDEQIGRDEQTAAEAAAAAKSLQKKYAAEMLNARRTANIEIERVRREALEQRSASVREKRQATEKILRTVQEDLAQEVAAQQPQYDMLLPELTDAIAIQLQLKRPQS